MLFPSIYLHELRIFSDKTNSVSKYFAFVLGKSFQQQRESLKKTITDKNQEQQGKSSVWTKLNTLAGVRSSTDFVSFKTVVSMCSGKLWSSKKSKKQKKRNTSNTNKGESPVFSDVRTERVVKPCCRSSLKPASVLDGRQTSTTVSITPTRKPKLTRLVFLTAACPDSLCHKSD